ncbi:MAG: hypothetical protein WCS87_11640 [Methylococcaceae bacterium]
MKRSDDVFFFTLIDFLVQVFFFGLLLYVLSQAAQIQAENARHEEEAKIQKLMNATGVSNLAELTDELSKLAPIKELKGVSDFINKAGGLDEAKRMHKVLEDAGGAEIITMRLAKLRKLEEGSGKPPCLFNVIGDKKVNKTLAVVVATDTKISFQSSNSDLEEVLRLLGYSYDSVKELSLHEFQKTFAPLLQKSPDCRYTLRFIENTHLVYARDSARFAFYLNIVSH